MAFTSLITAIVLTSLGVLNVEGTAKGAVPLDTLTFDKAGHWKTQSSAG